MRYQRGRCDRWNVFLHRHSGGTQTDDTGGSFGCSADDPTKGEDYDAFRIDARAILPDHSHTIWTLPEGGVEYPRRWAHIICRTHE